MNDFTLTGPLANNDIIQYSTALSKFTNKPITQLDTVYIWIDGTNQMLANLHVNSHNIDGVNQI